MTVWPSSVQRLVGGGLMYRLRVFPCAHERGNGFDKPAAVSKRHVGTGIGNGADDNAMVAFCRVEDVPRYEG
jgi:hypothetical protein